MDTPVSLDAEDIRNEKVLNISFKMIITVYKYQHNRQIPWLMFLTYSTAFN